MKAEDQYFIQPVDVWVTRQGNGIVEDRHLKSQKDHDYHKVVGREKRYVIRYANGIRLLPATLYERHLSGDAYFASSVVRPTRQYLRELDMTWFKYYDDAEEVLENIRRFISWAKTIPNLKIKATIKKRLMNQTRDLIADTTDTQETELIRTSVVGLEVKKRSALSPLARDTADSLDLKDQD